MSVTRMHTDERGVTLVELMVAILMLGVVTSTVFTVILNTQRTERFTSQVQDTMDDARLSLENIRQEIRAARMVFATSTARTMYFWVDQNQDTIQDPSEKICYHVADIAGDPGRYTLERWTGSQGDCDPASISVPAGSHTIAATLRNTDPFTYTPTPTATQATREVAIHMVFDVNTDAGPSAFAVDGTVRLRNVA